MLENEKNTCREYPYPMLKVDKYQIIKEETFQTTPIKVSLTSKHCF